MRRARSKYHWAIVLACVVIPAAVGLVLLAGNSQRPRAPALGNDPAYRNSREGFRFLAPEGWVQRARAEVPPGKLEKERLLVEYQRTSGGKMALLEVACADLSATTDMATYLARPADGVQKWRLLTSPMDLEINGVTATRMSFSGRAGKEDLIREVVLFRRGERVYFFVSLFSATDDKIRDELRRAVGSTIWNK
jgi:hypothetical protein